MELPNEDEMYLSSGGKHSFHGVTYQLKLLMLFIIRAMNVGYPKFRLATEMDDAGKFDDVIFSYPKNVQDLDAGKYHRFLQAKHTISDTAKKKIRAADLLNESDGDFSLQKYFRSYLKLSRNKTLIGENDEIKDLIICTNMSFKFEDKIRNFTLKESIFESVNNSEEVILDDILQTTLIRFKDEFQGRNELLLTIKNGLIALPRRFAECVLNEKEYIHKREEECVDKCLYRLYENALFDEVIDMNLGMFRTEFVNSKNLSSQAKHFYDCLRTEFIKRLDKCEINTVEEFQRQMKERHLKLSGNLVDPHQFINQPEKVSKKFADLLRRNNDSKIIYVQDDKSVIAKNFHSLTNSVLYEKDSAFYFRSSFLINEKLPGNLEEFRFYLQKQLSYFRIEFSELELFRFHSCIKYVEFSIDEDLDVFMNKLVFAVNQTNESGLEEVIMDEIKKVFNEHDVKYVYRSFLDHTLNWMKEKRGRYFSHIDAHEFFDGLWKEVIRPVCFNIKNPVHNFTGRKKELMKLKAEFEKRKNNTHKTVITQSVAVCGLGGVGKSELARKYAELYRSDYRNIIWIDCENRTTIESSFQRLAFDRLGISKKNASRDDKKIESVVEEVYLKCGDQSNLFIFDNADHLRNISEKDDGLMKYFPRDSEMKGFHFLITSRNQNWSHITVLILGNFTNDEAMDFIRNSLGNLPSYCDDDVELLSCHLNYFPLALQQAVSYIVENSKILMIVGESFSIRDYVELFEKSALDLLDYEFPADCSDSYYKTTFSTWHITLKQIEKLKFGDTAIQVLNMISYLSTDSMDVRWLSSALKIESNIEIGSAVELLKQYSLVSLQECKLSVHSLVQLVTRSKVKETGKEMDVLKAILNSVKTLEIDHSMTAWNHASKYVELVNEFSDIPVHIIDNLVENFQFKSAIVYGELSIKTLEECLIETHINLLVAKYALGKALYMDLQYEKSLELLKSVHAISKLLYGDYDSLTMASENIISVILLALGKYVQSLEISENVIEKGSATLDPANMNMLILKGNRASAMLKMGDYDRALKCLEEVYEMEKETLGEESDSALSTKKNIATALIELGKYEDGLKILNEISSIIKRKKNDYDITLISTWDSIVFGLQKQGKYEEALQQFDKLYEALKKIHGEEHPFTLKAKCGIANAMFYTGKKEEALKISTEACHSLKFSLGCNHEFTLSSQLSLALIHRKMENFKESLNITKDVYERRCKIHGENHLLTHYSRNDFAADLCCSGMEKKALRLLESTCKKLCEILGEENNVSMVVKHNIALVLKKQKKHHLSLKLMYEVYEQRVKIFGMNHPHTLESKRCIDNFYRQSSIISNASFLRI